MNINEERVIKKKIRDARAATLKVYRRTNPTYSRLSEEEWKDTKKGLMEGCQRTSDAKTLWEDFHKDETDKLENLVKEFTTNFRITKQEVEKEMLECSGEIIDLYYIIEEKYGKYNIIQSKRRGRPRKI